jgi:TonB family protein
MNRAVGAASFILAAFFSGASFATTEEPVAWVTRPVPTPEDFPPFAAAMNIGGWVEVNCLVTPEGLPNACTAMRARPDGLGFAEAAVRIIERARLTPAAPDALPEKREFTVRVPFNVPPFNTEAPTPWFGPTPNAAQMEGGRRFARRSVEPVVRLRRHWRLDRMPLEMRRTTEGWIAELFGNLETERQRQGLVMARVLALRELDALPPKQPDDWSEAWTPQLREAGRDIYPREPMIELRRRYCARYDCGPTAGVAP